MASTNFKVFNEANALSETYNDSEYDQSTQRKNGVTPGMAISRMHNKMYYQWSVMSKAIADVVVNAGYDCNDDDVKTITESLETVIAKGGTDTVQPIIDGTTPAGRATMADKANVLTNSRSISLTGAVTGSTMFNGSANVSIATTSTVQKISLTGAVTGSANFSGSNVSINTTLTTNDNFKKGMIIMWFGNANSVPSGWAICNGSNGTPDLRNRFIVGAGSSYGLGSTGGEAYHTLSINEMPSHKHLITWGENEDFDPPYGRYGSNNNMGTNGGVDWDNYWMYSAPEGGNAAHNNLPPYYGLFFIMKL